MLNIEETTLAINFCEYYIGQDKTQVRFSLEKFEVFEGSGEFLLSYNTEIKRVTEGEEVEFIIVNINQVATIHLFYEEEIKFEKKLNIIETLRYLDTKHIVANEWVEYFVRESTEQLEFLIKISVYLSEFNKKQLLDVKLKTTQAIQHKVEHLVIERNDNPAKKRIKRENERQRLRI